MYSNNTRFSSRRSSFNSKKSYGGFSKGRGRSGKQTIHPSKFIKAAKPVEYVEYTPKYNFEDFAIHPLIQKNIKEKGYNKPSAIQDQSIEHGLSGKDVVGIANTGTGKTAAFALPMLRSFMHDMTKRALIIAPTRELAEQIESECKIFAKGSGLFGALLIGGSPMMPQIRDLKSNPNIVIGTPGRIKDHVNRGTLKLNNFNIIILDEVDRMLDMGFIDDIRFLLDNINQDRQSFFFSATLDPKIKTLINTFSNDPVTISVKTGDTSDNVEQNVIYYQHNSQKLDKLHDILIDDSVGKTLVFDETKRGVEKLGQELIERGFKVDALHGDKSQGQRARALRRFKNNEVNILVATDVAARGIDVADITHVINYSQPNSYDDYTHRIGRAGRAGNTGFALTFVSK